MPKAEVEIGYRNLRADGLGVRSALTDARHIWLTVLCPGWESFVSRQPIFDMKPRQLVVSEDVDGGLDLVRIIKAASDYADLVAYRAGKGERTTATRTKTPLDL